MGDGAEVARPRDASTVVLLRPRSSDFEVFMVKRHRKSAFMGGVHVFPGGKVDDADRSPAVVERTAGREPDEAASALGEKGDVNTLLGTYVAAIRETFEEADVFLGDAKPGADFAKARRDLANGVALPDVLSELSATLRIDRLVPWTRWVTPEVEPRRYDTRFFLAAVPETEVASHDRVETTAEAWLSPAEALDQERAGQIALAPPTHRSLEMLAAFSSVESVLESARNTVPPVVQPVFSMDGETALLALPGHPLHPVTAPVIPGSTCFRLEDGRWWAKPPTD